MYKKVFKAQLSDQRRTKFTSAHAAAKAICDGASLFILSKAAVCFGTDQLARLLGPDCELRGPTSDELTSFTSEAEFYLNLAAECAWDGVECRSTLCAAYYAELVNLLGPVGIGAVGRLMKLRADLLQRGAGWNDPRGNLPPPDLGGRDDDLGPCLLEVRSLWLLLHFVAAACSKQCTHAAQTCVTVAPRDVPARFTTTYCLDCGRACSCACQEEDMDKEKLLARAFTRCRDALNTAQLAETLRLDIALRLLHKWKWVGFALPKGFPDRVQLIYNSTRAGLREDREVRRHRTAEQVRSSTCVCPSCQVLLQACPLAGQAAPCPSSQGMQLQLCGAKQHCLKPGLHG